MKKILLIVGGVLLLVGLGTGAWLYMAYRDLEAWGEVAQGPSAERYLLLDKGTSVRALGKQLKEAGALDDGEKLYRFVRHVAKDLGALKSGEYLLKPATSPRAMLTMIVRGETAKHKVTIVEGSNLSDIATAVEKAGLADKAKFLATLRDPAFCHSLGAKADHCEGYLAADTYLLERGLDVKEIARAMKKRIDDIFTPALKARATELGWGLNEVLTLASIVEKETGQADERPIISAVFHNRLKKGMKLQTDPTVIYGIPDYAGNIRKDDLLRDHPYNTYVHKGLPPGPIASPGEAAIKAALYPASSDALFFVSRNDGTHVFCPDYACHERNVQKWQVEFFHKK